MSLLAIYKPWRFSVAPPTGTFKLIAPGLDKYSYLYIAILIFFLLVGVSNGIQGVMLGGSLPWRNKLVIYVSLLGEPRR